MNKLINKILVVSLQGIGDLVLVTPALRVLRNSFPQAKISVLTFKVNADVLIGNRDVNEIIIFDLKKQYNFLEILKLIFLLRDKKFDVSICTYPSGLRSAFLSFLSGVPIRIGQKLTLFKSYPWLFTIEVEVQNIKHAIEMNLDLVSALGAEAQDSDKKLFFFLSHEDENYGDNFKKENNISDTDLIIGIHAGGSRYAIAYRNWPKENFADLANRLKKEFNAKIIFVGGPDDEVLTDEVIKLINFKPISIVGKTTIKETASMLKNCRLLICNNSAPMHIAAALGTPTISFFGPVDTRIHKPRGEEHIAITKELECHPCYYPFFRDTLDETRIKNRWKGKSFKCDRNYECLKTVTVEEVLELARKILKR